MASPVNAGGVATATKWTLLGRRRCAKTATEAHHQHRRARERRMHTAQQRRLRRVWGAPVALWVHQVRCCPAPRALRTRRVVQEAAHNLAALLLV
jgi:hypothetical protein